MIEEEINKIIRKINPTVQHIIGNQDGVHPNTVFCIVEEIDSYDIGEPTMTVGSNNGMWLAQQPREYLVNIGVQGKKDTNASEIANMIKLQLDLNPTYKNLFKNAGYSYYTGDRVVPVAIDRNTSRYVRHTLTLVLRTNISIPMEIDHIESIKVDKGTFKDYGGQVIYEHEEVIK